MQPSRRKGEMSIFDGKIIRQAIIDSFVKLDPRVQLRNPVMFVVEVGSAVTTIEFVRLLFTQASGTFTRSALTAETIFVLSVAIWLWFTVLFANFAEAMAEGRGKAQADTLRKARTTTMARRLATRPRPSAVQALAANPNLPAIVRGHVYFQDSPMDYSLVGQRGIPNALVILDSGVSERTDASGSFEFHFVSPGRHTLAIEPGTLPAGLIPDAGAHVFDIRGSQF